MSRILIIEDEPAIRRVLVKILSEEDKSHEIDEAENGIRIIITIGDVKGIIEKMTETTPSGFSAVNIPTYNAIITMKVIGNINCCASV